MTLTGNEETQRSYNNNILVKFSDLKELHLKTIQSIKSLNPAKSAIGIRIDVVHNEGEADKFNSFESFETHNITSPNPTAAINMSYTFTLYDKESCQFEQYKIHNLVKSRIAELKQLESEAPPFIPKALLVNVVTTSARIRVEYTDYVKARHFISMFDEWIRSCDESPTNLFIRKLKPVSHLFTEFGVLLIYAILAYSTIHQIKVGGLNQDSFVTFMIAYASIFIICGTISRLFLRKIERSIDGHFTLSYLEINKGDNKLIKEYRDRNSAGFKYALLGFLGTVTVGVFSNVTYDLIKWFLK